MSDLPEVHLGDVGTVFEVTIVDINDQAIDISSASVREITFKKPGGTAETKSASFSVDGTDGRIQYVSQTDDLDEIGDWEIQGYVETSTPAGKWRSQIDGFRVFRNL